MRLEAMLQNCVCALSHIGSDMHIKARFVCCKGHGQAVGEEIPILRPHKKEDGFHKREFNVLGLSARGRRDLMSMDKSALFEQLQNPWQCFEIMLMRYCKK